MSIVRPQSRTSLVLLVVFLTACGCGYRSGGGYQWRSLYRQDVKTVAVPIFATRDFSRGNVFELTSALVRQIEVRTPYKVVPAGRADTILEGEIVSVRLDRQSVARTSAVPQEQLAVVSVSFTWKDLRTGKILVQRRNFDQAAAYYPTLGEGRFVANQQTAEQLAIAIVQELQADW